MFILLRELSTLMGESKTRAVTRSRYYNTIFTIPKIKEILLIKEENIRDKEIDGSCPGMARAAVSMIDATFGIVLSGLVPDELTFKDANAMWDEVEGSEESRDSWEQLQWFIKFHSITKRLELAQSRAIPNNSEQMRILSRAKKLGSWITIQLNCHGIALSRSKCLG